MATNGNVIERARLMQREADFLGCGETFKKSAESMLEEMEKTIADARALKLKTAEEEAQPEPHPRPAASMDRLRQKRLPLFYHQRVNL